MGRKRPSPLRGTCARCGSKSLWRNGKDLKGKQKYRCKSCGSFGTLGADKSLGRAARKRGGRA